VTVIHHQRHFTVGLGSPHDSGVKFEETLRGALAKYPGNSRLGDHFEYPWMKHAVRVGSEKPAELRAEDRQSMAERVVERNGGN
jgi:hypothetical protein